MARHHENLASIIADPKRRADIARAAETSGDYLYQIATGRRRPSADLAVAIERATDGAVRKEELIFGPSPVSDQEAA